MSEKYCMDCEHHSTSGYPTPLGTDFCTAVRDIVTGRPIPCRWRARKRMWHILRMSKCGRTCRNYDWLKLTNYEKETIKTKMLTAEVLKARKGQSK